MKKFLFLAGVLAIAMTSCNKNEGVLNTPKSESVISFQPLAAVQTKSDPITSYVKGTGSFNVYAWYQATNVSTTFDPSKDYTLYMNNVLCKYQQDGNLDSGAGENTWRPDNTYYWPKNGKLTFSAYYPTDVPNITVAADKGITISDYTIDDAADQVDLMFSDRAFDRTSTTNTDVVKEYDGVDIVFNHALSALTINVRTADDYTEDAIKLRKVEIVDALYKGTFNENCENGKNDETHKAGWEQTTDTKTYTVFGREGDQEKTVTKDGWKAGDDCIVLPQEFSESIAIKVSYAIKYFDGDEIKYLDQTAVFPLKDSTTGEPATAITAWEMGKWYKYNFIFTLDKIYFAPKVDEWEEVIVNPVEVK